MNSEARILAANIRLKSTRGIRNGLEGESREDYYSPEKKAQLGTVRQAENRSLQAEKKSPALAESQKILPLSSQSEIPSMPLIVPKMSGPPQMPPLSVHNYAGSNKKMGAKN